MARLFTPRKTTLLFVIRDKTKSPLEKLESTLRQDIQKIWDSVANSGARHGAPLSEFFDLKVVALSNFEEKEEQFTEEVERLRERFSHSLAPGGLARDRGAMVQASGFSINAQEIWNLIKQDKDLDLPSLSVMVSTIRCAEIAQEKFDSFPKNKDWLRLEDAASSGPMPDFHRQLTSIIDACLSGFSEEAIGFDEKVRILKQREFEEKLLNFVEPAFQSLLGRLRTQNHVQFKKSFAKALDRGESFSASAFDWTQRYLARFDKLSAGAVIKQAKWETSRTRERENLRRDMDAHVASLQSDKLSKLTEAQKKKLDDALAGPVQSIFEDADDKTWSSIRDILRQETERAVSGFSVMISGFEIAEETKKEMLAMLEDYAKGVVESKVAQLAKSVLKLMKEKFSRLFLYDGNSNLRTWTKHDNVAAISKEAYYASAIVLSALSVVRWDDETEDAEILISPDQHELIWKQFTKEVVCMVNHAITTQAANRGGDNCIDVTLRRTAAITTAVSSIAQTIWTFMR